MGFVWVNAFSFFHCVASPFHSFVTTHTDTMQPASHSWSRIRTASMHLYRNVGPTPRNLLCYTENAAPTRHRPERQHNARANRRKQCSPNETKPYSKPTLPRKRQTTPTNGHTPRRWKPTLVTLVTVWYMLMGNEYGFKYLQQSIVSRLVDIGSSWLF